MRKLLPQILLFTIIFLFYWLRIDPRLLYQAQQPPFLFGAEFLSGFLQYPGGLSWYLSALLTQMYQLPFIGALLITVIFALVYWQTVVFMKSGSRATPIIVVALPVLALCAAYCNYSLPLTYALDALVALMFFNGYTFIVTPQLQMLTPPKSPEGGLSGKQRFICPPSGNLGSVAKISGFLILVSAVYYATGVGALLFAALCILYELLIQKKYSLAAIYLGLIAIVPYVAARFFFVLLVPGAYLDILGLKTYLLDAAIYPRIPLILYVLFLYFPAALCAVSIGRAIKIKQKSKKSISLQSLSPRAAAILNSTIGLIAQAVIMALLFALTNAAFFDNKAKINYHIDYYGEHRQWNKILEAITKENIQDYTVISQTQLFRALYFENRLLSDLFNYPGGQVGLSCQLTISKMAKRYPVLMSDLNFDAGALNAAEYWANEALSMQGKKTGILKRLVLIHQLKGEKQSAAKYCTLLNKTVFSRPRGDSFMQSLQNDSLLPTDSSLKTVMANRPIFDYVCRDFNFELANLMHANNKNKLALEYLMAYDLLNNGVSGVVDNIVFFSDAGYVVLPRIIQEALVFQLELSNANTTMFGGYQLDAALFRQFNNFSRIMSQYGLDRAAALKYLAGEYGATYWYYVASNGKSVYLKKK